MSNSGNPHTGGSQSDSASGGNADTSTGSSAQNGDTGSAGSGGGAQNGGDQRTAVQHFDAAAIAALLPHGDPFLFIEKASLQGREIRGSYAITGKEDFLRGHFKGRPVFPASIMLEALGQLAVLYLLVASAPDNAQPADPDLPQAVDPEKIFFTSCDGVRCQRVCTPGDTLEMVIRPKRLRHPASAFEGSVSVNGERAVFAEKITLVFDFLAS